MTLYAICGTGTISWYLVYFFIVRYRKDRSQMEIWSDWIPLAVYFNPFPQKLQKHVTIYRLLVISVPCSEFIVTPNISSRLGSQFKCCQLKSKAKVITLTVWSFSSDVSSAYFDTILRNRRICSRVSRLGSGRRYHKYFKAFSWVSVSLNPVEMMK